MISYVAYTFAKLNQWVLLLLGIILWMFSRRWKALLAAVKSVLPGHPYTFECCGEDRKGRKGRETGCCRDGT